VKNENVAVTGIEISLDKTTIGIGEKEVALVNVFPINASNTAVSWYIEDGSIAEINPKDDSCEITGKADGTTVLTAVSSDGGYYSTLEITVDSNAITTKETTTETTTNSINSLRKRSGTSRKRKTTTTTTEATTEVTTEGTTESAPISSDIKVTIGSKKVVIGDKSYDMDVAPYIQTDSNSTLVPLRFVALAISGGDVENADDSNSIAWNATTKTATIRVNDKVIQFTAGSDIAVVDGKSTVIENNVKAEISDGRMFIPFRALGKALGVTVDWDGDTRTAIFKVAE
jgi:hypothetical protein